MAGDNKQNGGGILKGNQSVKKVPKLAVACMLVAVGIVGLVLFLWFSKRDRLAATTMRIMRIEGDVTLEEEGKKASLREDMMLHNGNALYTQLKSYADLNLDESKVVGISEDSEADFNQEGKHLHVNLNKGSLFFYTTKKLDKTEKFDIQTHTMMVGIRGTSAVVSVDNETGESTIHCTEGQLEVEGTNPKTGEKKRASISGGQSIHTYLYNDRKKGNGSIEFRVNKTRAKDLPGFYYNRVIQNKEVLGRVLQESGYNERQVSRMAEKAGESGAEGSYGMSQESYNRNTDLVRSFLESTNQGLVPSSGNAGSAVANLDHVSNNTMENAVSDAQKDGENGQGAQDQAKPKSEREGNANGQGQPPQGTVGNRQTRNVAGAQRRNNQQATANTNATNRQNQPQTGQQIEQQQGESNTNTDQKKNASDGKDSGNKDSSSKKDDAADDDDDSSSGGGSSGSSSGSVGTPLAGDSSGGSGGSGGSGESGGSGDSGGSGGSGESGGSSDTPAATVAVTGVAVNPTEATIQIGGETTLSATVSPENATNKSVSWSSSNANIAKVDGSGKVTGVSVGEATITATTAEGGFTAGAKVVVNPVSVMGVSLSEQRLELVLEEAPEGTLSATVKPENATNKTISWLSADEGIAKVNSNGKVTAVSEGETTITVATADGGFTASATVLVKRPLPKLELVDSEGKTSGTLVAGHYVELTARFKNFEGNVADFSPEWKVEPVSILNRDNFTGDKMVVSAIGYDGGTGEASVTVSGIPGVGTLSASYSIKVVRDLLLSVGIEGENGENIHNHPYVPYSIYANGYRIRAMARYQSASGEVAEDISNLEGVTWSSSDPGKVTVSGGMVTVLEPGEVSITVEYQGKTDTIEIGFASAP